VVSTGRGMQELRYELTARGSYDGLLAMMDRLRDAKRIIRLNDWRIRALQAPLAGMEEQPAGESEAGGTVPPDFEMMATLSFYYTDQYAELFAAGEKE